MKAPEGSLHAVNAHHLAVVCQIDVVARVTLLDVRLSGTLRPITLAAHDRYLGDGLGRAYERRRCH